MGNKTTPAAKATSSLPAAGLPDAQMPGELELLNDSGDDTNGVAPADDGSAARIAELEGIVAQQNNIIAELSAKAASATPAPARPEAAVERVIGGDWASRTAAEAQAAGVKEKVLCKDGWYVPGA